MDTIRVGTHCFGSREGYRTLARSADVTDAEDAELGGFGFGQSADPAFLESLEREPSAFGRPLAGGRLAITRIFQGDPDEAGRATLELRTILVAPPDIAALAKAGLGGILQLPGLWKREAFRRGQLREILVPEPIAMADPADAAAAETLFDAWASAVLSGKPLAGSGLSLRNPEDRPVIVAEPATIGSAAITMLASQLSTADLARLRWGVRLVSTAGPVDLCTLAAAGRPGGRREVRRVRLEAAAGSASPGCEARPLALARVAAERSMEVDDVPAPGSAWRPLAIAAGVVLALLLIAQGTWMWISARLDREPVDPPGGLVAQAENADGTSVALRGSTPPILAEPEPLPSPVPAAIVASPPSDEPAIEGDPEARPSTHGDEPSIEPAPTSGEGVSTDLPTEETAREAATDSEAVVAEDQARASESSDASEAPEPSESGAETSGDDQPAASGSEVEEAAGDPNPLAPPAPPDPCAECAALAGRFAELAEDARRAEAFGDREALESAARAFAESMRSIGLDRLDRLDPQIPPRVMARVRDRPGSAVSMPEEWPQWRELICRLEALESALANLDAVASQLAGRGAPIRQELMRLRKDSAWILGSERADAESLRAAIAKLRRNLAADWAASKPSRAEEPRVEAIRAWLSIEPAASGGGEGRFDPPGAEPAAEASSP